MKLADRKKDPLLIYMFVAAMVMSALSVGTWIGRPSSTVGSNLRKSEELRSLASIEATETRPESTSSRWEVVQLKISCSDSLPQIQVAPHQHQVQFEFQNCPQPPDLGSLQLVNTDLGSSMLLFSSDQKSELDSEIVQLKEGPNPFSLKWTTPDGQEQTIRFTIERPPVG